MFVREKSARGHTYLYLVENEREGGRVRQRIIRALGRIKNLISGLWRGYLALRKSSDRSFCAPICP